MTLYSLLIILAGMLWGGIAIFVDELSALGLSSIEIVALRVTLSAIMLVLYALIRDRNAFKIKFRDFVFFVGTGIISVVCFNFLYFETISVMKSVAIPALLLYTSPIFVMIMSVIFFKERITALKILSLLISVIGLAFITGAITSGSGVGLYPLLLGLGSGFCYALYTIFSRPLLAKYSATTITMYTFIFACVAAIPISGIWNSFDVFATLPGIAYGTGLALVCTVSPFCLYTQGLKRVQTSKAAILATVEPMVAALVGLFVFGETLTTEKVIGMVLIFGSIVIINLKKEPSADG